MNATNKLISLDPTFEFIWADKGDILLNLGKADEALEVYKKSLELEPDDPDTLYEIAKIYSSKRDSENTLAFLKKTIECEKYFDEIIECGRPIKNSLKDENEFNWLLNDLEFQKIIHE